MMQKLESMKIKTQSWLSESENKKSEHTIRDKNILSTNATKNS